MLLGVSSLGRELYGLTAEEIAIVEGRDYCKRIQWSLGTVTGWPIETADEMRARAATYKVCAAELAGVRDLEMYYSDPWRVER